MMVVDISTMSQSHSNTESPHYLCIWLSLGKASADRVFDIQDAGKISPAPLILGWQGLAMLPGNGLRCVRCDTWDSEQVTGRLHHSPEERPPMTSNQDLR